VEQWAIIILAAGRSSRMGRAKQLVVVDGESMVRSAVKVALATEADQVVLVTGAYADEIGAQVADFVDLALGRLQIAHNSAWAEGQAGSMQTGLRALADHCGAAIFFPVDQPYMPPLLLTHLAAAWQAGAKIVAPAVEGKMRGAPALFDRTLWPELFEVTGDVGGRDVLRAHAHEVQTIDAPAAWLRDLDTPEDLTGRWRQ
jgi:molybdenum cofactor cytidylyltransferase